MRRLPLAPVVGVLCTLALLVAAPARVHAQTAADREAVRQAILDYVEGFYEGDSTRHVRSVRPDVYKYGYAWGADSAKYMGMQMTWCGFLAYANRVKASGRPTPATAPREIQIFEVLDQTASAKLTAWWGIDYLLLAKHDGKWMISHVLWQTPARAAQSSSQ